MDPFADVLKPNKKSTVTPTTTSSDPFADVLPPKTKPSPEQVAPRPLGSEIITIGSNPASASPVSPVQFPQLPVMESLLDKAGLKGVVKDVAGNLLKKLPSLGFLDKVTRGVNTAKELSEGKNISDKGIGKAIQPVVGAVNITGSLIQGASNIPYQNFMKNMYEYQALPPEQKDVYASVYGVPRMPGYASELSNFGKFSEEKLTGIGAFLQEKSGQDPQAFDNQVLQALGGIVPFLAVSYAGGGAGLATSIVSNSAINAEDVYEENLKQGKTQEEALKKYTNTFNSSLVLNSILTTFGVQGKLAGTVQQGFKQKGIEYVKDVLAEVFEENGEQIITNFNTGKPWATGLAETTLVTLPVAMITGGLGIQSSKDLVEKQEDIKQKEQEIESQKLEMVPNIDPKTQEEVLAWQESYNFITEVFQQNERVIETPNTVIQVNMTPFGDGKYSVKLLIDDGQSTQEIDFNRIYNSKEEAQQAVTRNEQILSEILAPEDLAVLDVAFQKKPKVDTTKDLFALRNIPEGNIQKIVNTKGMPAPSVAITKKGLPYTDFGEVTLVGDEKLIQPSKDTQVYAGDIYSPTTPRPTNDIRLDLLTEDEMNMLKGVEYYTVKDLKEENSVNVFNKLREKGVDIDTAKDIVNKVFEKEYIDVKKDKPTGLLAELISSSRLIKKIYSASQDLNDFWLTITNEYEAFQVLESKAKQLGKNVYNLKEDIQAGYSDKVEYNAENIVERIKSDMNILNKQGDVRGSEGGMFGARANVYGYKKFNSVEEIRQAKDLIVSKEDVELGSEYHEQVVANLVSKLTEVVPNMVNLQFSGEQEYLGELVKNYPVGQIKLNTINNEYFGKKYVVDQKHIDIINELIKDAYLDNTVDYFEVKIMRAVQFNEFKGALVPNTISEYSRKTLIDSGLKVVEYDPSIEGDREAKLNSGFSDLAFQKQSDNKRMINRERAIKDLNKILKRLKLDLDVQFVETILTPDLETAFGVYYDGVVSFTEFITDTTVIHEIGHAIFKNLENIPMFKGITRKELYAELRKEYPTLDEYDLEEKLMEKLEVVYGELVLNKPKTLTGKIKQFLEKTFNAIKGMFSNKARTAIDDFIERTVLGEADTEVTLPSTGDIDKYLKGDTLSFEGFERPKFLNNRVSQARIEKEFEAMFKRKETFGQGVKVGRADMKNKYANMTVEQARKRKLEDLKKKILERNYYKQGLDAIRNNIPPTERFGFMKQLAKVDDSSSKFTEFLSDVYNRKAQIDILKGEKRVTAMKRSKIGFLRKVNELDPVLIRDIKQMFNIRDVYKRGDKKGLPKENLKPINQYTSEELDMFISELNKRINYLRANGYIGQPTMQMLDSNDMEEVAKLAVASDKRLANKTVALGKKLAEGTRDLLKTLEYRLKFAPEIYDGIRRMEMEMKEYMNNFTEVSKEFAKTYKKLDPVKQKMLDAYLYSQEWQKAEDLMVAEGMSLESLTKIRTTLDDIYAKLTSVGIDVGYLKDYFPRYLRGEVRDNSDLFEKMLDKKREKLGRTETEEELASTAVTFLRGFANGDRILLSDGRFVENRLIDKITDPDIMNMYETSPNSLEAYVEQAIKLYVEKKFFNKLDPKLTQELATSAYNNAIANYTDKLQLEGKITGAQNQELREVLSAYFSITQSDPFSSALRNVSSMLALGKILSAVPQLIESFISVSEVGPVSLVKGFMNIHKIGLEDVLADTFFEANEISLNKVAKVVTIPMRAGDYVAGRALVNALFQDIRTMAKKGDKETLRLFERLFGDQGARYMKEFGELPSNVSGKDLPMFAKDVINSQVRKYRVTGRLEKSATFIKNPNMTFLKSYMAKMLNEIVYRGNDEMARGYKENDPKLFTAGLRKKIGFAIMLMIAGVATSAIRDFLRGKDLKELPDYVFTTLFSLFGLSYYGIQNFERMGVGGYVIDTLAPATLTVPADFIDTLIKDITKDIDKRSYSIEDYKTLQALSFVGDFIQFFQNKK